MSKIIVCKICSKSFEWSDAEIQFYQDRSLADPKRCPACRAKKRRENEQLLQNTE